MSAVSRSELDAELDRLLSEDLNEVLCREQETFDKLSRRYGSSFVLCGAGNLGRKTLFGLRAMGIEPLAFADNNPALHGSRVEGVQVLSPQDAASRHACSAAFVVTTWRAGTGAKTWRDAAGYAIADRITQYSALGCETVVPFGMLFWRQREGFFPHGCLDAPHVFHTQTDQMRQVWPLWADETSRREYISQLRLRLHLDFGGLAAPVCAPQYFPEDVFTPIKDEIFADCGAFDGDTVRTFLGLYGADFRQVVALEPDPASFKKLEQWRRTLPSQVSQKILALPIAVGSRNSRVPFEASGTDGSRIAPTGLSSVQVTTLDEILAENGATIIKMDIEGAEIDALKGATRVIISDHPILAICVYHRPNDLWKVPLFISTLDDEYCFFLRPHDHDAWETVCYAIPENRLRQGLRATVG